MIPSFSHRENRWHFTTILNQEYPSSTSWMRTLRLKLRGCPWPSIFTWLPPPLSPFQQIYGFQVQFPSDRKEDFSPVSAISEIFSRINMKCQLKDIIRF